MSVQPGNFTVFISDTPQVIQPADLLQRCIHSFPCCFAGRRYRHIGVHREYLFRYGRKILRQDYMSAGQKLRGQKTCRHHACHQSLQRSAPQSILIWKMNCACHRCSFYLPKLSGSLLTICALIRPITAPAAIPLIQSTGRYHVT